MTHDEIRPAARRAARPRLGHRLLREQKGMNCLSHALNAWHEHGGALRVVRSRTLGEHCKSRANLA